MSTTKKYASIIVLTFFILLPNDVLISEHFSDYWMILVVSTIISSFLIRALQTLFNGKAKD